MTVSPTASRAGCGPRPRPACTAARLYERTCQHCETCFLKVGRAVEPQGKAVEGTPILTAPAAPRQPMWWLLRLELSLSLFNPHSTPAKVRGAVQQNDGTGTGSARP